MDNPDDFKPEVFPWVIYERGKEHCFVFPEYEYPGMIKVSVVVVNYVLWVLWGFVILLLAYALG